MDFEVNKDFGVTCLAFRIRRFPEEFMFALTRNDIRNILQIVTCLGTIKHVRNIRALMKQGVAVLATVLRSDRTIDVNIAIMRSVAKLRQKSTIFFCTFARSVSAEANRSNQ